ncbi:MBL fold metallo-hydrolase [Actinoplanes sp. NPDC051513]|uniref:MBL fold metallo-hydrolase n=1 Tax=Actinoplanes sp. NPDC051513 TaxID=3363908 RepID=UPI0037A7981C
MDVVELLPELVMFRFPVGHAYLWRDPSGLTLIDTGVPGSAPAMAAALEALGHRPTEVRRILLTHFHGDHAGSAAEIAGWGGAEVFAHRLDAPTIRGETTGPPPILVAEWERELFAEVHAGADTAAPVPPVQVDHELDDGDQIDLGGGIRAACVAAPGHTPGSVAFHLPDAAVLFTGDTIARGPDGTVMLGVFNYDPPAAAASLRKQAALRPSIACFGHGDPLTDNTAAALQATADTTANP